MSDDARTCQSVRYAPRKPCAEDGPKWDVVTYTRSRDTDPWKITLRHPACFVHALAEVDGYASIVGSARVEFIEAGTMPPGVVEELDADEPERLEATAEEIERQAVASLYRSGAHRDTWVAFAPPDAQFMTAGPLDVVKAWIETEVAQWSGGTNGTERWETYTRDGVESWEYVRDVPAPDWR